MGTASNLIILLDLIQAGATINNEISEAFRRAESENRNITPEELAADAEEIKTLYAEVMRNLS